MGTAREHTAPVRRPLTGALLLSALLAGYAPVALAPGAPPDELGRAVSVSVVLAPRQEAILSAEVTGRVVAVNRELGQSFEPQDVLIQLDDVIYAASLRSAEARCAAADEELTRARKLANSRTRQRHAEAALAAAQANLAATQQLFENGHQSKVELENARRDVVVAETDLELTAATTARELAKAQRELATSHSEREVAVAELRACTIAAPYAGRVARVLVHEHELVDRGQPVIEIVDDRVLRARFLLPSQLFRAVRLGQSLRIRVDETGDEVTVKVSHVAATLDAASRTFEVLAELDNRAGHWRAGMNARLPLAQIEVP
jgi:multidrug resistance efflux pump